MVLQPSAVAFRPYAIDSSGRVTTALADNLGITAAYQGDGIFQATLVMENEVTVLGTLTGAATILPLTMQANDIGQISYSIFAQEAGQPIRQMIVRSDVSSHQALFAQNQFLSDGRVVASVAFLSQGLGFNNSGSAVGVVQTQGPGVNLGVYVSDATTNTKILHTGEPAPDGLGSFMPGQLYVPMQNDRGQIVTLFDVDDIIIE